MIVLDKYYKTSNPTHKKLSIQPSLSHTRFHSNETQKTYHKINATFTYTHATFCSHSYTCNLYLYVYSKKIAITNITHSSLSLNNLNYFRLYCLIGSFKTTLGEVVTCEEFVHSVTLTTRFPWAPLEWMMSR